VLVEKVDGMEGDSIDDRVEPLEGPVGRPWRSPWTS
jgi:hypothetical protein